MEEKSLLKFTTAIPFPLLVYKVKGDFEPIISEEQWDRCRQIMHVKEKLKTIKEKAS